MTMNEMEIVAQCIKDGLNKVYVASRNESVADVVLEQLAKRIADRIIEERGFPGSFDTKAFLKDCGIDQ